MSTLSPKLTLRLNALSKAISLTVFALIFLISCEENENINPLLGTWTLKAITTQNCKDQSQNLTSTFGCENSSCNKYTFSADGTVRLEQLTKAGTTVIEGTYTISNKTVVTHISVAENPTPRTFNFDVTEPSYLYLIEIFPYGTGKCSTTTVLRK
jgi:hypothetical protein